MVKAAMPNRLPARLGEFVLLVRLRGTPIGEVFVARSASRKKAGGLCFVQVVDPGFAGGRKLRLALDSEKKRPPNEGLTNLFDAGVTGGVGYLAYEFCDELSLEWLVRRSRESGSPLSWAGAVQIGVELLGGLEASHASAQSSGPHGDIRPGNVFISRKGRVILGRAQPFWKASYEEVLGFDLFVPPELKFAGRENIDVIAAGTTADLWGAAAVLWSLLFDFTRQPDWALGAGDVAPLAATLGAPETLDDFFGRALNPVPQERFETAADMREALAHCLDQVGKYAAAQDKRNWFLSLGEPEIVAERALISERIRCQVEQCWALAGTRGDLLEPGAVVARRYHLGAMIAQDEGVRSFEAKTSEQGDDDSIVYVFGRDWLADSSASRRLRQRIRQVVGVDHPAVAPIDWMGTTDEGSVFLVTQRWNGRRLNWADGPVAREQEDVSKTQPAQRQAPAGRLGAVLAGVAAGALAMGLGGMLARGLAGSKEPARPPFRACEELSLETAAMDSPPRGTLKQSVTVFTGDVFKGSAPGTGPRGDTGSDESSTKKEAHAAAGAKAADALAGEGRRLFRASRLDEAQAALQRAARLPAHRPVVPYLLGKIAFQKGRYPKAARLIERAVAMSPRKFAWRNYLGKVYLAMGDKNRALEQWKRVLVEDPGNEEARRYAGADQ